MQVGSDGTRGSAVPTQGSERRHRGSAATMHQLRVEIDELRRALRTKAVIDQATGVLAERLRCGLSDAFGHLNQLAHDTDLGVAEAAELLVGEFNGAKAQPPVGRGEDLQVFNTKAFLRRPAGPPPVATLADQVPALPDGVPALLDGAPNPMMLLAPVRDSDSRIVDFSIARCNIEIAQLRGQSIGEVEGRSLLELYPSMVSNGLFDSLAQVDETGEPLNLDTFAYHEVERGELRATSVDVRAQAVSGLVLVGWRLHGAATDHARRWDEAERMALLGWGEWNLYANTVIWSQQLYQMHDRNAADGPMTLEDYPPIVHPEDLPIVAGLLRGLLERPDQVDVEYRIVIDDSVRHLRVIAKPVLDPRGQVIAIRAVFQNITAHRTAEQALAESRARVEHQRRRATLALQRAVLPSSRSSLVVPGYRIAVRCLRVPSGDRIGGDWCEANELPNRSTFVAIGDFAGRALTAAAGMARLGNALRGLAITEEPPKLLLEWLNRLVYRQEAPEVTASALVGYLDPDTPAMTWAQAGHPPPLLVRDGKGRLLATPGGVILGAQSDGRYGQRTDSLELGDLVVFYTDGLVERRGQDIDEGIDDLVRAAEQASDDNPHRAIDQLLTELGPTDSEDDTCLLAIRVADH